MNFKKIAAIICCLAFMAFGAGATLAWLTDEAGPVTNTFTVGKVEITLDEAVVNEDGEFVKTDDSGNVTNPTDIKEADRTTSGNSYKTIPGFTYPKDPTVTVKANSEDCYLFVEFEQGDASTYYAYESTLTVENGWTQGNSENGVPENVWFRKVDTSTNAQSWNLLANNTITVRDTVTEDLMDEAVAEELVYTAYAIQYEKTNDTPFGVQEAWDKIPKE